MTNKKTTNPVKKYNLSSSTWTHKAFHGVLHTMFPVAEAGFPMKKFFGDNCEITLFYFEEEYGHWYWNDNDLARIRETFFRRLRKDPHYLDGLKMQWGEVENI